MERNVGFGELETVADFSGGCNLPFVFRRTAFEQIKVKLQMPIHISRLLVTSQILSQACQFQLGNGRKKSMVAATKCVLTEKTLAILSERMNEPSSFSLMGFPALVELEPLQQTSFGVGEFCKIERLSFQMP